MGSNFNLNFKGIRVEPTAGNGARPPLSRQSSIYSLTLDEFQSTVGMNFGSMNMDELLKNICSAEENQNLVSASSDSNSRDGIGFYSSHLQRQGSLTLPRTLSHKTVDEVWHDILKDFGVAGKDAAGVGGGSSAADAGMDMNFSEMQRQPTFREITLEEFLVRAGVEIQPNNADDGNAVGFNMYQDSGLMNAPPAVENQNQNHRFPAAGVGILDMSNATTMKRSSNNVVVHTGGGGGGIVGFGGNNGIAPPAAAMIPPDIKINVKSPVPYAFNGNRKTAALEKVVERRQRRMIKNRESAARSRARKQAYTMELEAEVNKLKEENEALMRKQAEMKE
ncbi:hypothetical protein M569_10951, partial [Genlisea aurea]